MHKLELEKKIDEIRHSADSPAEKERRIALVQSVYDNGIKNDTVRAEAKRQHADEALKAQLKAAFMANGAASESDFEAAWPNLRLEALSKSALAGDEAARRAQFESARSQF